MGLVTDICLKRKVRNYVQIAKMGETHNDILVKSREISGQEVFINGEIRKMYKEELGLDLKVKEKHLPTKLQQDVKRCVSVSMM